MPGRSTVRLRHPVRSLLVLSLAAWLTATPGAARQAEPIEAEQAKPVDTPSGARTADDGWAPLDSFAEEVTVEVVEVQVRVTDRQGRPVTGLGRGDFEVLVDGEPVEITNFAAYEGAAELPSEATSVTVEREAAAAPAVVPEEPETLQESRDPLHLAILVDDWNLRPEDRARVLEDLRGFVARSLVAGDRASLIVHDRAVQMVQGFTDRPAELAVVLDRVEKKAPSGIRLRSARNHALDQIQLAYELAKREVLVRNVEDDVCITAHGQIENAIRQYAATMGGMAQRSGGALATVVDVLAGLPGRKALVYVGNGLPQQPGIELVEYAAELCPNQQSNFYTLPSEYDMTWLYDEVVDRANGQDVTLYTIEASGAAIDTQIDRNLSGGAGADTRRFTPSTKALRVGEFDSEAPLAFMAHRTGGRAILDAADFALDFERLATDLRSYYSLGFRPVQPADDRLHRLKVRVPGDRYRVLHRETYRYEPLEQRMAEQVRAVAQFGGGDNPLGVRVEVGEAVPEEVAYRVPVRVWVPLSRLTLIPGDDGVERGRLQVLMSATDRKGDLTPVRQKVVPVEVQGGEQGRAGDQLIEVDLALPPGEHTVAVAVRDTAGGETSYLRAEFPVPTPVGGPGAVGR